MMGRKPLATGPQGLRLAAPFPPSHSGGGHTRHKARKHNVRIMRDEGLADRENGLPSGAVNDRHLPLAPGALQFTNPVTSSRIALEKLNIVFSHRAPQTGINGDRWKGLSGRVLPCRDARKRVVHFDEPVNCEALQPRIAYTGKVGRRKARSERLRKFIAPNASASASKTNGVMPRQSPTESTGATCTIGRPSFLGRAAPSNGDDRDDPEHTRCCRRRPREFRSVTSICSFSDWIR
jgi:hypothetical protein